VRSPRNSPSSDDTNAPFSIDYWAKGWHELAAQALKVIAAGENPMLVELPSSCSGQVPLTLFQLLDGMTRRLCEIESFEIENFNSRSSGMS
jgi:hypothetical protein